MKFRTRRFPAALAVAALPLALLSIAPSAGGAVLGTLKIGPPTGSQSTLFDMSTLAGKACPAGTDYAQAIVTGGTAPVLTDDNPGVITSPDDYSHFQGPSGNVVMAAGRTMSTVFAEVGVTVPSGVFTYKLQCLDSDFQITDEYTNTVTWTPAAGAGNGTYVASSTATPTEVTVGLENPGPVVSGTANVLSATVTPADAAGTVRFKSGTTFLTNPINVVAGHATLDSYVGAAGLNNLTAVFTPTDAAAFGSDTSAVTAYSVLGAPAVSGTVRVGQKLTCTTPAVAPGIALPSTGRTVLWFRNGTSTGSGANPVTAPPSWLNQNISCKVTLTKDLTKVERTSAARKVTAGAAPVARVRPKVLGTARVARTLTCSPGTWSPTASSYRYQWFRGAAKIPGKINRTYRTVRADKGKSLSCQVTAVKTGYLSGVAKAPARKIL